MIVASLIAGILFPYYSFLFQVLYAAGRLVYSSGYYYKGPNARVVGAILFDICLSFNMGLAYYSCI